MIAQAKLALIFRRMDHYSHRIARNLFLHKLEEHLSFEAICLKIYQLTKSIKDQTQNFQL